MVAFVISLAHQPTNDESFHPRTQHKTLKELVAWTWEHRTECHLGSGMDTSRADLFDL